jgi:septal ring factor EnvC (AmiA/AmiB activator)
VTGFSPAFLNFGRVVPCTGEFYGKVAENPETLTTADREDHAKNLEHLKTILQDVTQHLHKAHERNERSYNLRKRDAEYFVGDKSLETQQSTFQRCERLCAKISATLRAVHDNEKTIETRVRSRR